MTSQKRIWPALNHSGSQQLELKFKPILILECIPSNNFYLAKILKIDVTYIGYPPKRIAHLTAESSIDVFLFSNLTY